MECREQVGPRVARGSAHPAAELKLWLEKFKAIVQAASKKSLSQQEQEDAQQWLEAHGWEYLEFLSVFVDIPSEEHFNLWLSWMKREGWPKLNLDKHQRITAGVNRERLLLFAA